MTDPTTEEAAQLQPLQDGLDKCMSSTDLSSITCTSESLTRGHDADLQAIEPSVAEMPQARRLPPASEREAGIKTEPIVESASDMDDASDDASDTDDNHDSKNQWEYERIVKRWEDPHGRKLVKLKWANQWCEMRT
jgi:hypothetical protein